MCFWRELLPPFSPFTTLQFTWRSGVGTQTALILVKTKQEICSNSVSNVLQMPVATRPIGSGWSQHEVPCPGRYSVELCRAAPVCCGTWRELSWRAGHMKLKFRRKISTFTSLDYVLTYFHFPQILFWLLQLPCSLCLHDLDAFSRETQLLKCSQKFLYQCSSSMCCLFGKFLCQKKSMEVMLGVPQKWGGKENYRQ